MDRNPDPRFKRTPLPPRLCNLDRLLHAMAARNIDGLVITQPLNVFYLSSFNAVAQKSDEPRPYAVVLSRHAPDHPVLVIADYYLATVIEQPTWIEDVRLYRGLMLGIDVEPGPQDVERFIPANGRGIDWVERARKSFGYDMDETLRGSLADLGLARGRIAFDDMGYGFRLGLEQAEVADAFDTHDVRPLRSRQPRRCRWSSGRPPSTKRRSTAPSPPGSLA